MHILVTNVFGPLNRGDHELFAQLLRLLEAPSVQVSAIARDPDLSREHFPRVAFFKQLGKYSSGTRLVAALVRALRLACCVCYPWIPAVALLLPLSQRRALEAVRSADLVIGCPGGFLEDSTPSLYPHIVQLLLPVLCGKRLILAPMSIGPVGRWLPRRLLGFVLRRAERIFVREEISQRFCDQLDAASVLSNDLAFLNLDDRHLEEGPPPPSPSFVSATLINWSFPLSREPARAREIYCARAAAVLEELARSTGLPVRLIVQVAGDLPVIEDVASRLDVPCEIMREADSPAAIKQLLRRSYCLLATRFHSAIFSLSVGCPVLALSYLPKTQGMLELYGLGGLSRPIENFDPEEVSESLLAMGRDREAFRGRVADLRRGLERVGNPFLGYLASALNP